MTNTSSTYHLMNMREYQSFNSIAEMDKTVRLYNKQLNKSHYETLNVMKQYSCKVIGVSHLKIDTIANKLGKSKRTIIRHINHLKEQGMITVVNTSRVKSGGKGANVYVINPLETQQKIKNDTRNKSLRNDDKKQAQSLAKHAMEFVKVKKQTMELLSYLNSFKSTRDRKRKAKLQRIENIKQFRSCPQNVPDHVYMLNKAFFSDSQISAMYRVISKQLDKYPLLDEQREDITLIAFKSLVKAMRKHYRHNTAPIKNMYAYVCKTAQRQAFLISSKNMFEFVF